MKGKKLENARSNEPEIVPESHKPNKQEDVNRELQIYLTEYTTLRAEVISSLDTQRQLLTLELAVIGVAVSGIAFFQAQPILYLFGALLLGLLSWIMFEHTLKVQMFYDYFDKELCPKIRELLRKPDCIVFGWQTRWFSVSPRTIFYAILSLAKFLLGLLLALAFWILFWISKKADGFLYPTWSFEEKLLYSIDIVVFVIPLLLGLISVLGLIKRPAKMIKNQVDTV